MSFDTHNYKCSICQSIIQNGNCTIINGNLCHTLCAKEQRKLANDVDNIDHAEQCDIASGVHGVIVTDRGHKRLNIQQNEEECKVNRRYSSYDHSSYRRESSISVVGAKVSKAHSKSDLSQYHDRLLIDEICGTSQCNEFASDFQCKKCQKKICFHCIDWEQHDINEDIYLCKECPPNLCQIDDCGKIDCSIICFKCEKTLCGDHWYRPNDDIDYSEPYLCTTCAHNYFKEIKLICTIIVFTTTLFNLYWMIYAILDQNWNSSLTVAICIFIAVNILPLFFICIWEFKTNVEKFILALTVLSILLSFGAILIMLLIDSLLSHDLLTIAFGVNVFCVFIYRILFFVIYRKYPPKDIQIILFIMEITAYIPIAIYWIFIVKDYQPIPQPINIFKISVGIVGIVSVLYEISFCCCR